MLGCEGRGCARMDGRVEEQGGTDERDKGEGGRVEARKGSGGRKVRERMRTGGRRSVRGGWLRARRSETESSAK